MNKVKFVGNNSIKEENMETVQKIALCITIIGAINWGLVGIFNYDLVANIFGGVTQMSARVVYVLIALCGLINIQILFTHFDRT